MNHLVTSLIAAGILIVLPLAALAAGWTGLLALVLPYGALTLFIDRKSVV